MNMATITITLPAQDKKCWNTPALQYSLSLSGFSRLVFEALTSNFGEESFEDYDNPDRLRKFFEKSLLDYKSGRVQ